MSDDVDNNDEFAINIPSPDMLLTLKYPDMAYECNVEIDVTTSRGKGESTYTNIGS